MPRLVEFLANLLRSPRGLRNILVFKLVAALALFAVFRREIFLGEILTTAAPETTPAEAVKGDNSSPSKKEKSETGNKNPPVTKENGESGTGGETQTKRKSFLDDLLNLPKIEPESMKKESLGRYLTLAEKKKQQLEARLDILKRREIQLLNIEKSIDDKLQKLDDERRFFSQSLQKEKDLKGKRVDRLIDLYAKMEPRKAAPIIEKLDRDLVVEIFKQVDKKQAKSILEAMDAQKSVELTEYFGRVRSAREYDLLKELNLSLRKEFQDCKGLPQEVADPDERTPNAAPKEAAQNVSPSSEVPGTKDISAANGTPPPVAETVKAPEDSAPKKVADAGKPETSASDKSENGQQPPAAPSAEEANNGSEAKAPAEAK